MKTDDEKFNAGIKYNYWIFLISCLFVVGVLAYEMSRDSSTGDLDVYNVAKKLVQMFISSSLAWIIENRFHLRYIWICGFAGFGFILPILVEDIFNMLMYGRYLDEYSSPGFMILAPIVGALVIAIAVLIISYPLQRLFHKNISTKTEHSIS